jgi:hypothetical protein
MLQFPEYLNFLVILQVHQVVHLQPQLIQVHQELIHQVWLGDLSFFYPKSYLKLQLLFILILLFLYLNLFQGLLIHFIKLNLLHQFSYFVIFYKRPTISYR